VQFGISRAIAFATIDMCLKQINTKRFDVCKISENSFGKSVNCTETHSCASVLFEEEVNSITIK
jgi:hypothetical protein